MARTTFTTARVLGTTIVLAVAVCPPRFSQVSAQEQPTHGQAAPSAQERPQGRTLEQPVQAPKAGAVVDTQLWFDNTPKSTLGAWLSRVDINFGCTMCAAGSISPPANSNAPWALQGSVRHEGTLGAFSAGFVGVRDYAPPLYTAMPIGGDFNPGAVPASAVNLSPQAIQWHVTAAFQRTLATTSHGATFGLTADVVVPVNTDWSRGGGATINPLPSRAVRLGLVFRW